MSLSTLLFFRICKVWCSTALLNDHFSFSNISFKESEGKRCLQTYIMKLNSFSGTACLSHILLFQLLPNNKTNKKNYLFLWSKILSFNMVTFSCFYVPCPKLLFLKILLPEEHGVLNKTFCYSAVNLYNWMAWGPWILLKVSCLNPCLTIYTTSQQRLITQWPIKAVKWFSWYPQEKVIDLGVQAKVHLATNNSFSKILKRYLERNLLRLRLEKKVKRTSSSWKFKSAHW